MSWQRAGWPQLGLFKAWPTPSSCSSCSSWMRHFQTGWDTTLIDHSCSATQLRSDILLFDNTCSPYHHTLNGKSSPSSHSIEQQRKTRHLISTSKSLQLQCQLKARAQACLLLTSPLRACRQAAALTPEPPRLRPSSVPTSLPLELLVPPAVSGPQSRTAPTVEVWQSSQTAILPVVTTTTITSSKEHRHLK